MYEREPRAGVQMRELTAGVLMRKSKVIRYLRLWRKSPCRCVDEKSPIQLNHLIAHLVPVRTPNILIPAVGVQMREPPAGVSKE